jgi:hypothetical protein
MDGGFEIFLVLMFVFWVLESIAKARQRPRPRPPGLPEGSPTEQRSPEEYRASYEERIPSELPEQQTVPTTHRAPDRGQRPPTLMEVLAAELQRAKEAQRQARNAPAELPTPGDEGQMTWRRAPAGPESSVSAPPARKAQLAPQHARTAPRRAPAPASTKRTQPPRRPPGGLGSGLGSATKPPSSAAARRKKSDAVLRGERSDAQDQFAERDPQERTSSAWASGMEAERGSTRESERGTSLEADRSAGLEAKRAESLELAPSARRHGLQRAGIKESQKTLESVPRKAQMAAPAASWDPRRLIGASPAELRRILVLNEVLGPPIGLREERFTPPPPRPVEGEAPSKV